MGEKFKLFYSNVSITDKSSCNNIKKGYYDYIRRFKPTVDIILFGNKADLDNGIEVTKKEAIKLAHSLNIPFAEISNKKTKNIKELIFQLISRTKKRITNILLHIVL